MAYTISYTDALNKGTIVLEDNTLNTTTSLRQSVEILLHMVAPVTNFYISLENFAFNTATAAMV